MAAAEEHQQRPHAASPTGENAAHVANQVSSKSAQKPLGNGVEKGQEQDLDTETNAQKSAKEAGTELSPSAEDAPQTPLRGEGAAGSVRADPAAADAEKDSDGKTADPVALEDAPVPMDVNTGGQELQEDAAVSVKSVEHVAVGGEKQEGVKELPQSTKLPLGGGNDGEAVKEGGGNDKAAASKETAVAMEVDDSEKREDTAAAGGEPVAAISLLGGEASPAVSAIEVDGATTEITVEEVTVAMEVDGKEQGTKDASVGDYVEEKGKSEESAVTEKVEDKSDTSEGRKDTTAASAGEDVEMAAEDTTSTPAETKVSDTPQTNDAGSQRKEAEVTEVVGQIVSSLIDDVVGFVDETVSMDAESIKLLGSPRMLSSPDMHHLSADEAIELLEVHQGDDHELLPEHDDGADADVETEPSKNREYQWFDGDEDDDEGVAIEAPSALDVSESTDDVFGFGGVVDLAGVTPPVGDNAGMNSDGSADTLVIPSSSGSSSSSSASSGSSSSSSSPSSSSASSASEDENAHRGSKKRLASGSSGPRKLLNYKKQKRSRHSDPESSRRRPKRKRKIPEPDVPKEFDVFQTEAADPILKGSYAVRNNRRACFVGNWGFSDEAFTNIESVSPFEYTSRTRVPQSRRKDDKRPISGRYGGFFKLRQFNGTLVKIREDQVDLQFLPMPPSDEENDDEDMEGYDSDSDDGEEPAATRYIVLGKGKNRFGRFLIRGYLNPQSGRLTVKRRYLE